jgi:hypothetical protein
LAFLTTEEAIINALIAAKTMTGANGDKLYECPEKRLVEILRKYGRIEEELLERLSPFIKHEKFTHFSRF